MGLIGMAFGLGFVLGPMLGGLLVGLPVPEAWRLRLPFLVAAGFSTLAWLLVLFYLPESLPRGSPAREAARVVSWRGLADTMTLPGVGQLVLLGFLSILAFASLEGTLALFLRRRMEWNARSAAFAFAGLGLISAFVQGSLDSPPGAPVWRTSPDRRGDLDRRGWASPALALASSAPELAVSLILVGIGQGLVSPRSAACCRGSRLEASREPSSER